MSKTSPLDRFSKKHFHHHQYRTNKVTNQEEDDDINDHESINEKEPLKEDIDQKNHSSSIRSKIKSSKHISKMGSFIKTALSKRIHEKHPKNLVVGTLFGLRRGLLHVAFQKDVNSPPSFLFELPTTICDLVKEMESGLVRITLESKNKTMEEGQWKMFCNGKKCGFANMRECGSREMKVFKTVGPISTGTGVLPKMMMKEFKDDDEKYDDREGEVMYMRGMFERIVGTKDSEAFYMMNPDRYGSPELSIYLVTDGQIKIIELRDGNDTDSVRLSSVHSVSSSSS